MTVKKRGLGRGLDALLGSSEQEATAARAGAQLRQIPVEMISAGKYQPRREIDTESLRDLAESIRAQGVMQPIVVRPVGQDRFEIIAGERRWRASQLAEKEAVPAIVRDADDETALALSLIENIQRENLNPMEEAHALKRLQDEFHLTHQQMADAVGKSRTTVTNFLRLTGLDPRVATMLERGELEMGHARALLTLSGEQQVSIAREVGARGLNVRQAEALARRALAGATPGSPRTAKDADTRQLEEELAGVLGQPVSIHHTKRGRGRLVIRYSSLDELDGVLAHLRRAPGRSG